MIANLTKKGLANSFALVVLVVLLCSPSLVAHSRRQKEPEPNKQQSAPKQCQNDQSPQTPLTLQFNVLVTDVTRRLREDVEKGDFKIWEDGIPQQTSFLSKREGPLSYGLVVDCSGSLRAQFSTVVLAAEAFVAENAPEDETFLVKFTSSENIELVQDWTSEQSLLKKRLEDLYVEAGHTAIIDAVYESATHLFQHLKEGKATRRSALVLITDGEDLQSYYKEGQLLKLLKKLNIQVFVIGLTQQVQTSSRKKATELLLRLAQESGGRVLFPSNAVELAAAVKTIRQELLAQYFIGYTSTNQTRDNSVRQIRIEIADTPRRDRRLAIARTSFVALCQ